jgi:hypothetical protein
VQSFFKRKPKTKAGALPSTAAKPNESAPSDASSSSMPPERHLGLHILHEPRVESNDSQVIDIIFVHGLGGSAYDTWAHPSSKAFWPSFLYEDDKFSIARISTFGYDANVNNIFRPNNVLDITDFAKQLLDRLDLHYQQYGEVSRRRRFR